ncbi:MAG: hypothetical protein OQL28_10020 [Sedimenticola sp.]|nr:hypothetical protein [Sedimenticola sp.]
MSESVFSERERIIAALSYPRSLMEQEVTRRQCPEHHRYNDRVEACRECLYILECQARSEQLAEASLQAASGSRLHTLLQLGMEYVSYQPECYDHRPEECACDHCGWLRRTRALLAGD